MTLKVEISDSIAREAYALAEREHTTVDALIAASLMVALDRAERHPTIAERAARVDWPQVDVILARVQDVPPLPGDELPRP